MEITLTIDYADSVESAAALADEMFVAVTKAGGKTGLIVEQRMDPIEATSPGDRYRTYRPGPCSIVVKGACRG